ncbi:MAG: pyridoxal phosphate-dependent aminotransferase, partial [Erysipelotrichaceae bacterium]|nr:pyridoxal phosphate-dependent aminotransferase [Erysipelotrichaceae bacterium]
KLGLNQFKESFAGYVRNRKGELIDPSMVLPVDSAARGMYIIADSVLKPGDEMIVFDPCDYLFRESCMRTGAKPVLYPVTMDPETRRMDLGRLEEYITPKTKMFGLCNPHNPFGLTYTDEDLEHIMSLCEKYDLYIMNDEIWSDIIYTDAKFNSIYTLGNERCRRVLSVFGFSKSYGLAGLRIGCIYTTDKDIFEKLVEHSDVMSTAGGAASLSQIAAIAAMDEAGYYLEDFLKQLEENRDYAVDFINRLPYLKAYRPQATYLLYVDIAETGMSGAEFSDFLIENVKLAIVPGGRKFFGDQSEGHIRICFATSRQILEEGLKRLEKGIRLFEEKKKTE